MADECQHKLIVGSGLLRHRGQRAAKLCRRSLRAVQGIHMGCAARGLEYLVKVLRIRGKALLVIRLAAQARDRDIERRCVRGKR